MPESMASSPARDTSPQLPRPSESGSIVGSPVLCRVFLTRAARHCIRAGVLKGLLHRRRASHHRCRGRLLPCPRRPERTDHCRGSRNIRTGIHARRAAPRLDRAASARPDALGSEDLEALATHGEGPDRRSLDGVAGDGVGIASIACSFVSSILNIPTCLTPATGDAGPKMQDGSKPGSGLSSWSGMSLRDKLLAGMVRPGSTCLFSFVPGEPSLSLDQRYSSHYPQTLPNHRRRRCTPTGCRRRSRQQRDAHREPASP